VEEMKLPIPKHMSYLLDVVADAVEAEETYCRGSTGSLAVMSEDLGCEMLDCKYCIFSKSFDYKDSKVGRFDYYGAHAQGNSHIKAQVINFIYGKVR
jgi:hypothetical protein